MAAITWSDVEAMAPDLSAVATDAQTMILAYVNDSTTMPAALWRGEDGALMKLGRVYLAAHMGQISLDTGAHGPLTSKKAGDIASTFGAGGVAAGIATTGWGQQFRHLALQVTGGVELV